MDNIPKVEVPKDREKIERPIKAFTHAISKDIDPKDKQIHKQALKDLKSALESEYTRSDVM